MIALYIAIGWHWEKDLVLENGEKKYSLLDDESFELFVY